MKVFCENVNVHIAKHRTKYMGHVEKNTMVLLNAILLLITLKINNLNTPVKRWRQNRLKRTNGMTYNMHFKDKNR